MEIHGKATKLADANQVVMHISRTNLSSEVHVDGPAGIRQIWRLYDVPVGKEFDYSSIIEHTAYVDGIPEPQHEIIWRLNTVKAFDSKGVYVDSGLGAVYHQYEKAPWNRTDITHVIAGNYRPLVGSGYSVASGTGFSFHNGHSVGIRSPYDPENGGTLEMMLQRNVGTDHEGPPCNDTLPVNVTTWFTFDALDSGFNTRRRARQLTRDRPLQLLSFCPTGESEQKRERYFEPFPQWGSQHGLTGNLRILTAQFYGSEAGANTVLLRLTNIEQGGSGKPACEPWDTSEDSIWKVIGSQTTKIDHIEETNLTGVKFKAKIDPTTEICVTPADIRTFNVTWMG